jgi:hypothetical protein
MVIIPNRVSVVVVVVSALALAASLWALASQQPKPVQAQTTGGDTECADRDNTDPSTYLTGTFENIVVPQGEECVLSNSEVSGDVTVLDDARLFAYTNTIGGNVRAIDRSRSAVGTDLIIRLIDSNNVRGNVEATGASLLRLTQSNTVGGSVLAREGANILICGTTLPTGSIQVRTQTPTSMYIGGDLCGGLGGGNTLNGGSIQVAQNEFAEEIYNLNVSNNQVAQDLVVSKNTGAGQKSVEYNTVGGNLQCKKNDTPFDGQPNYVVGGSGQDQCAP